MLRIFLPEKQTPPIRILLAEDNKPDVLLVEEALHEHGVKFELSVVNDGEQALELIDDMGLEPSVCPDIILLDLNLPKRSGTEILERMRQNARCADVPVVILTSSDSPKDRSETSSLGATCYFQKPVDLDGFMELGALVRDLVTQRRSPETL